MLLSDFVKNDHKEVIVLLRITAACYFIVIFIFTCTENITMLYREKIPRFKWNSDPDFSAFFNFTYYSFTSPTYIFQKTGHAVAFFLLTLIVFVVITRVGMSLLLSFSFALFTEIAQLFFHRTGCLLDVGYDMAGVFGFVFMYYIWMLIEKAVNSGQFDVR
jgi:VanZ family protein